MLCNKIIDMSIDVVVVVFLVVIGRYVGEKGYGREGVGRKKEDDGV